MKKKLSPLFLKYIKIVSFGAFSNKVIGPFTSGANVVYAKNEGGKTTLNALVSGVLFGWEDARGGRNTYKPNNAQRCGSLFFEDEKTQEEYELFRAKNAEGIQGQTALLDDIDKETFSTMFALTSDELRDLRNTTDVTAKLLTAGSGTNASPSRALAEINKRIAEYTSRAAVHEHSVVQLIARQEELRNAMTEAAEEAEQFKLQDKEFHELSPEREEIQARLQSLSAELETLATSRVILEKLEHEQEKNLEQIDRILEEKQALDRENRGFKKAENKGISDLETMQEFAIRDRIDSLLEESNKLEQSTYLAREDYVSSKAAFEALSEGDVIRETEKKARAQRQVHLVATIVLPVVFALVGVLVFIYGREINSLSFTALGVFVILFALLLAGTALLMLFRPNKSDEALLQRKQDAQWVMLQDGKRLEACEEERLKQEQKVFDYLGGVGLEEAHGSLKRARAMLDEMKDTRTKKGVLSQKKQALSAQLGALEEKVLESKNQRENMLANLSFESTTPLSEIDRVIAKKNQQRIALEETRDSINRRYGELKQELSQAKKMRRFDELKLEYQQVRTQQKDSLRDCACLLLAKRTLENAISSWESKSQPEVYKQASRLLEIMTGGKWVKVRMSPEGNLQIVDGAKTAREPVHLSLATCQQLYLSLRIALLMTAENVGLALPVLADDILVNFDAERSRGAVDALLELATRRQVILFTCHEEIVRLLQSRDSHINTLEL
jgi:uncharacterized protein YhaN